MNIEYYLREYSRARPIFLSLIRAKEAYLFSKYTPFKGSVLDVGCGDGFFASIAFADGRKKKIPTIDVGLDLASSRMKEAEKTGVYKKFVTYDGIHMPFENNSFQTIVSNCVYEHVGHLKEVMKEQYRVLKPGGQLITTVMARPWEKNLAGAAIFGDRYRKFMRRTQVHKNLYSHAQWDKIFVDSGFEIGECIGYLSPASCRLIDVCHYVSIPNLISYKLFGKWVLTPGFPPIPVAYLSSILKDNVLPKESGALFYVLKKAT